MMKTTKHTGVNLQTDAARHTRLTCLVSDEEMRIIDSYLHKYGIANNRRGIWEPLTAVNHGELNLDDATLVNEHDMPR